MTDRRFVATAPGPRRIRRAITDLVDRELPARELLDVVQARLRMVVPFTRGGWWTTDPETLLPTELWDFDMSVIEREIRADHGVALESEPRSSAAGSELRFIAPHGGHALGAACWTRTKNDPPFSHAEIAYITEVAREVGGALRADLLRLAMRSSPANLQAAAARPGTLLLSEGDRVEGCSSEARSWLERLGVADPLGPLPATLRWISLQARTHAASAPSAGLTPARSHLPTPGGELILVRAEALEGPYPHRVVMTLESATASGLFPLLVVLYGLSEREQTVARLVVEGLPLDDIAATLSLSPFTVRDHVKSLYVKVGVRSRPELTARLGTLGTVSAASGM